MPLGAHLDDLLDKGLVRGYLGLLQRADLGPHPRDENKLGAHRQLVASVQARKAVHALIIFE